MGRRLGDFKSSQHGRTAVILTATAFGSSRSSFLEIFQHTSIFSSKPPHIGISCDFLTFTGVLLFCRGGTI